MGVMRFIVDDMERITDSFLSDLYIASVEQIPWRCFAERVDEGFQVRRKIDESGSLYAMWQLSDGGQLLLSTANLRVREQPYVLPVELARGTLNRLRNQAAAWQQAGLEIPSEVVEKIAAAGKQFCDAATNQHDLAFATDAAQQAIRQSLCGCQMLLDAYVDQLQQARQEQAKPTLMFGTRIAKPVADVATAADLTSTFNVACIEPRWSECEPTINDFEWLALDETVDWAQQQKLKTMVGPILAFDSAALPDWLVLWEDDFHTLQSYVVNWVKEVVDRFRGEINIWHCSAKMNSGRVLTLTDEQRLKLTVSALEVVRHADPKTPVIVSFDQPWAEYMTHVNTDVAPLHYADALARSNLGVAGLGLHIDWGYRPVGTQPRNLLELSQLLDQWSLLGLPLVVFLSVPASLGHDPHGSAKITPLPGDSSSDWNAAQQNELATRLAEICWCKQSVQGVIWSQTFDAQAHTFPNSGLFDSGGNARPLLASMRDVAGRFLG